MMKMVLAVIAALFLAAAVGTIFIYIFFLVRSFLRSDRIEARILKADAEDALYEAERSSRRKRR